MILSTTLFYKTRYVGIKGVDFGFRKTLADFKSVTCALCTSYLIFLSLSFLVYKMKIKVEQMIVARVKLVA